MARSSASASNAELRHAIGEANDAAVKALLAQGRSVASLVGDYSAIVAGFEADQRQRENVAARADGGRAAA